MIPVIALSLSILVVLGGLYLLSKSKKDSLGSFYTYSSYSAIILGAILFVGTIVGSACMMRGHAAKGHNSCYVGGGHGSSCDQGATCAPMGACGMKGHHGMRGHGGMKGMHGMHGKHGSCGMNGHHGMGNPHMKSMCSPDCKADCPHKKEIDKEIIIEESDDVEYEKS